MEMSRCANCGQVNPEGFLFCGMCARPLAKEAAPETRRTVTVLFSDLAGSTAMGERLDPEAIRRIMSRYFRDMQEIIERHGGRLEKFIGDAIKADFGAPVAHEDDALRAVRAALEMREAQERLNDDFEREWGIRLAVRTGVNTGEVVAATSGEHQSLVLGDTVNTAARFEQAAPPGEILLGETTYRLVRQAVEAEPVEPLTLKGKTEPVPAYRLVALRPEGLAVRPETPLVDREEELDKLEAVLEQAVDEGRCLAVAVVAEPGVGKSRLVAELGRRAEGALGARTGRCLPYGEGITYWPVMEIVRRSVAIEEEDPAVAARGKLEAYLADEPEGDMVAERLAQVLGLTAGTLSGEETTWAVRRFVEALAREQPLILVVEDVHWAEDILLDLLEDLPGSLRDVPVLLLATARPEIIERRPGWVGGDSEFRTLDLAPLPEAESVRLVQNLLGDAEPPVGLVEAITGAAEGNPLFVEETLSMLRDTGALHQEGGRWVKSSDARPVSIPPSLALLVQARIDALPRTEQGTLSRAAVIGRLFTGAALEAVSDQGDAQLRRLVERGFIEPDELRPGEYAFRHAMVRDTAYERLPKMGRAELHERLAMWLEGQGDAEGPEELVGAHLERAFHLRREVGSVEAHVQELAIRACRALATGGRRAMARGDPAAAEALLARLTALAAAQGLGARTDGIEVIADVGKLAVTLGRWETAVNVLSPQTGSGHPPILRDLGVAVCKLNRTDPDGPDYRRGQAYLEEAAERAGNDADAFASLAGTWKGIDETQAAALYRRALDVDPSNPYALGNLVEYEVRELADLSAVSDRLEDIGAAVERCRRQAMSGENLPWAFYDMGKFLLLLNQPHESLAAYAKAIHATTASYAVEGALGSLQNLESVRGDLEAYDWDRRLLVAALAGKFRSGEAIQQVRRLASEAPAIMAPVVMMAGGTTAAMEGRMERYRGMLLEAFGGFRGVLISGGTRHGIGALAGDIGEAFPDDVWTIGYIPARNPDRVAADDDPRRYREIRTTGGEDFTPIEPLQAWLDLLASGIPSSRVKVLGIDGGPIAGLELRIALALGASVGVIRESGREAEKIFRDTDWVAAPGLVALGSEGEALQAFLG
jgi:class 3 adenylate cyclase/tetratricopeptide (TPR) repeat protein